MPALFRLLWVAEMISPMRMHAPSSTRKVIVKSAWSISMHTLYATIYGVARLCTLTWVVRQDVRPPLEGGVRHSGSPFWLLLNDADFDGVFTEFACQGMQCSAEHASFVTGHGGKLVWLSELLGTAGAPSATPSVCARFQDVLDSSPGKVFVSFDIDSIRSSDCPGVSCPATIGLTADHALGLCYLAGKHPRVAMVDVSEMNPAVEGYRTPRLVAFMLYHFLLGLSQRAKKGREPK